MTQQFISIDTFRAIARAALLEAELNGRSEGCGVLSERSDERDRLFAQIDVLEALANPPVVEEVAE